MKILIVLTLWLVVDTASAGCLVGALSVLTDVGLKLKNQTYHVRGGTLKTYLALIARMRLKKFHEHKEWVPLSELRYMHPVNYPITGMWKKVRRRIDKIETSNIDVSVGISIENQRTILESKNPITVVIDQEGNWIVKDGNSRLYALKQVFRYNDPLIEVVVVDVDHDTLALINEITLKSGARRWGR